MNFILIEFSNYFNSLLIIKNFFSIKQKMSERFDYNWGHAKNTSPNRSGDCQSKSNKWASKSSSTLTFVRPSPIGDTCIELIHHSIPAALGSAVCIGVKSLFNFSRRANGHRITISNNGRCTSVQPLFILSI